MRMLHALRRLQKRERSNNWLIRFRRTKMGNCAVSASRLEKALALARAPVAITFAEPAKHDRPQTPVTAGCQFWQWGSEQRLVTTAEDHANCAIGIHTHSLSGAPNTQANELNVTLAAMQGLDYVRPDEVAALPTLNQSHSTITYQPLADCQELPALVLIFADARQGLIITEAVTRVDDVAPPALGRPACMLVPVVLNSGTSASSLGCCGARAYLEIFDDEKMLWGLHGAQLEAYVDAIETLSSANETLQKFHRLRRSDVEAGKEPTIEDSLARLAK